MQVKGEAIEEHISDKEEAYISKLTKATYQCCISAIETAYQRHISAAY
jgi:hypothetical protein